VAGHGDPASHPPAPRHNHHGLAQEPPSHPAFWGFWAAFWGALVISVVSWILDLLLPD